jgi:hypothetical protein
MEKQMTKVAFLSVALIAAAAFTTQAKAAGSDVSRPRCDFRSRACQGLRAGSGRQ